MTEKGNKNYAVDRTLLPGMCEELYHFVNIRGFDLDEALIRIKELGVKSFRIWIHFNYIFKSFGEFNLENVEFFHNLCLRLKEAGIRQIIGMSHNWFLPGENPKRCYTATPYRDMEENSNYQKFLSMYENSWKDIAEEFPEIEYWEIGNEHDIDIFLHPMGYNGSKEDSPRFTMREKIDITTDMMYRASKGIHSVRPDAMVVMPGMAPSWETMQEYLEGIYKNIKSGDWPSVKSGDFFQVLCWHPYYNEGPPDEAWTENNIAVYEIAQKYGEDGKKVFLSEFGYSDLGDPEKDAKLGGYLKQAFENISLHMPFVESVHIFRLFNDAKAEEWGGQWEVHFGLYKEPSEGGKIKEKGIFIKQAFDNYNKTNR